LVEKLLRQARYEYKEVAFERKPSKETKVDSFSSSKGAKAVKLDRD